jgi:hypothetical protein
MGTVKRPAKRPWGRELLFGVALGYVSGLLAPHREFREPAKPPAPRPRDVPVEAPCEEPVRIPLHRVA